MLTENATWFIFFSLFVASSAVLQFVPQSVDIRLCTFSEQIQKGLSLALFEVRRLRQERENLTVQVKKIVLLRTCHRLCNFL